MGLHQTGSTRGTYRVEITIHGEANLQSVETIAPVSGCFMRAGVRAALVLGKTAMHWTLQFGFERGPTEQTRQTARELGLLSTQPLFVGTSH